MRKIISALIIFCCVASLHAERTKLITSASQLTISNLGTGNASSLIDGNKNTAVHSKTGDLDEASYIEVELNESLSLGEEDDLIVVLQRCSHSESEGHPTILRVEGRTEGSSDWEDWDVDVKNCQLYFLFRGAETIEYSTRFRTSKQFKHLRFTVLANSGRKYDKNGYRYMGLAEFQIYKLGRYDNYSDRLVDRFHLITDYFRTLQPYSFVNTMGVLDARNREGGRDGRVEELKKWCDWSAWSNDGKWTKDVAYLEANGLSMPEYTMLTSENDGKHGYKPDPGQKRQPTHVTEHILYAIPGDAIALYPYYSFKGTTAYQVNFSHWYDYQSGGHLKNKDEKTGIETAMLDFLIDPSDVSINNEFGYFAGREVGKEINFKIFTPEDYIDYCNQVNNSPTLSAQIMNDLDFTGYDNVRPLAHANHYYGTLEGNGHTIKNLVMNYPTEENIGLVGKAGNDCCIRNLIIDSSCKFIGMNNVAAVAGSEIYANPKRIENVQTYAVVEAKDGAAAAIIAGRVGDNYKSNFVIRNCFVGGSVTGKKAAAVAIADPKEGANHDFIIENTVSVVEVNGGTEGERFVINTKDKTPITISNCYDLYGESGNGLPDDMNSDKFVTDLGDQWVKGAEHVVPGLVRYFEINATHQGKIATFFCPRSPYSHDGSLQSLPFRPGEDEFVIAADFSQSFSHTFNIDHDSKKVIEPIIQFRHIFRIRDGKEFAESFSGSPENNAEYVRKNVRRVSARANVPFQIRLDSPIPQKGTTRSKYYYKISDIDYRRVCTMNIEAKNLDTGETRHVIIDPSTGEMRDENNQPIMDGDKPSDSQSFYYGEAFDGEGSRQIDGITYNICGGGGRYYRMLKCDAPQPGNYLVRIFGNDINGNPIYVYDPVTKGPSTSPLVVMEMQLTVLPESAASLVDEDTLYGNAKYEHAREEVLEKAYGEPKQRLAFDEYVALESLENVSEYLDVYNSDKCSLKWPLPWDEVTYSFDYNHGRDYNMYRIANHSSRTDYAAAAANHVNPDGSKGLYDRLYYKSYRQGMNPPKHGYFYYVNASADPGVMARLRLDDLCMGSTIHVSAWVAEFSALEEKANISFNFVAVLKDGERIPLHSYISGYVPEAGEWYNIYYSFVPNYSDVGINADDVEYYELELDNNCKNSQSADYAVDNIRMYVTSPILYAIQNEPVCDKLNKDLAVRVETPFDVLLQVIGETEAAKEDQKFTKLYYTFIDKDLFDKTYKELKEKDDNPGRKAYEAAVLRYNYDKGGEGDQTFGKVNFNLNFASNPEYGAANLDILPYAFSKKDDDGNRLIVFNTRPSDEQLTTGKPYYVSIYPSLSDADENPGWNEFDITSPCARVCEFKVTPKTLIKVDGEARNDINDITCCEHQAPVIQVDLWGKNIETGELLPIEENARMDWYDGRYDDGQTDDSNISFVEEKLEKGILLSDALAHFREVYPDADNCDVEPVEGLLTQDELDYLKIMTKEIPEGKSGPRLRLSQTSYVFQNTTVPPGADYAHLYVVAIPITVKKDDCLICSVPTEIHIRAQHRAPVLNHGLVKNIPYPDGLVDVPLRMGLKQLQSISVPVGDTSQSFMLYVPIRKVVKAADKATAMKMIWNNPYIYLVETNDPEYEDLGTLDEEGNYVGTFLQVGVLSSLDAKVNDDGDRNFGALFYNTFHFKEGYYYRMRFMFEENATDSQLDGDILCHGQDVFTIKVVPEYQKWSASADAGNLNWNNDANWSRVSSSELCLPSEKKMEMDEFVNDGMSNSCKRSYAPLDFTKVIIPKGEIFPHLINHDYKDLSSDYSEIKKVHWVENPSADAIGNATENIQFDMVAYTTKASVKCRPWYVNTCEQIHFMPDSEISGQGNLDYKKAWVDIATVSGRWYTLSTPLRTVFAGDMYLPSDNARQESELFTDIEFNKEINDRFSPAVYQRGWNKSKTNVYELSGYNVPGGVVRNVAVKAEWSNVYNDVTEIYGGGTGFSVKTDASRTANETEVVFRLPKSDKFFDYYSEDGNTVGNRTEINRGTAQYLLNNPNGSVQARSAGDNLYFLVGNPFMGHLDMAEFFKDEENKGKIQPKYWVLTDGTQQTATYDESTDEFIGDAGRYVAPMQGFFVEVLPKNGITWKDSATGETVLDLKYNEQMACVKSFEQSPLKVKGRVNAGDDIVRISALRGNEVVSQAFINLKDNAERGYNAKDDAVLIDNTQLDIAAMIYTVADNKALSVNTTDEVDGTEIGLVTTDDQKTVLLFNGVEALGDIYLYDVESDRRTPLYDGLEYPVNGSVSGRLYLMSGSETIDDALRTVKVSVNDGHVRIETGEGKSLRANVYTVEGILLMTLSEDTSVLEFTLENGVYILETTDGVSTVKRKVLI